MRVNFQVFPECAHPAFLARCYFCLYICFFNSLSTVSFKNIKGFLISIDTINIVSRRTFTRRFPNKNNTIQIKKKQDQADNFITYIST